MEKAYFEFFFSAFHLDSDDIIFFSVMASNI